MSRVGKLEAQPLPCCCCQRAEFGASEVKPREKQGDGIDKGFQAKQKSFPKKVITHKGQCGKGVSSSLVLNEKFCKRNFSPGLSRT